MITNFVVPHKKLKRSILTILITLIGGFELQIYLTKLKVKFQRIFNKKLKKLSKIKSVKVELVAQAEINLRYKVNKNDGKDKDISNQNHEIKLVGWIQIEIIDFIFTKLRRNMK